MRPAELDCSAHAFRAGLCTPVSSASASSPMAHSGLNPQAFDAGRSNLPFEKNLRAPRSRSGCTQWAAIVSVFVGLTVLWGWAFQVQALKDVAPGLATMKPNTALAFVLTGIGVWLATTPSVTRCAAISIWMTVTCVMFIGGATVFEYVSGTSLGIDELLFRDADSQSQFPGRPSIATAVCILLVAIALVSFRSKRPILEFAFQLCTLIAMLVSGIAVAGYLYGVDSLYSIPSYSSTALHTAVTMARVFAGLLAARPDLGLMAELTSRYAGGTIARKLLPVIVLLSVVFGWLRLKGEQQGFYRFEFGVAMFAVLRIVVLSAFLWGSPAHLTNWTRSGNARLNRSSNIGAVRRLENCWNRPPMQWSLSMRIVKSS